MRGQRDSDILRHASLRTHRAHAFIGLPKTNQPTSSIAAFVTSPLQGELIYSGHRAPIVLEY